MVDFRDTQEYERNKTNKVWETTDKYPIFTEVQIDKYLKLGKVYHAYGGFEGQGEIITAGVGDWNHITNVTNDLWNLDECDGILISDDVLTINNGGDYSGVASMSISGLNTKDFHVRIYNLTQAKTMGRDIGVSTTGANNEVNVCLPLYIEADSGDRIQFEVMSSDGADPTFDDGLFVITYLHE